VNKQDHEVRVAAARQRASQFPTVENRRRLAAALAACGMYAANCEHDYPEAILLQEEAISMYDSVGDKDRKAAAYFNICRIYEVDLHRNDLAYAYARKALELAQNEKLRGMYEAEFDCLTVTGLREGWIGPRSNRA
jgi:tetratricopeptide (TPR) repeat protein